MFDSTKAIIPLDHRIRITNITSSNSYSNARNLSNTYLSKIYLGSSVTNFYAYVGPDTWIYIYGDSSTSGCHVYLKLYNLEGPAVSSSGWTDFHISGEYMKLMYVGYRDASTTNCSVFTLFYLPASIGFGQGMGEQVNINNS